MWYIRLFLNYYEELYLATVSFLTKLRVWFCLPPKPAHCIKPVT